MARRRISLLMSVALTLLGLLPLPALARRRWTAEELNARIQREDNPVKKAKLVMDLAHLELSQATDAYGKGDYEQGAKLLETYTGNMQQAWTILCQAKRNPVIHPQGFKELEINLREGHRLIQDLAHKVTYDVRDPVLKAESQTVELRNKVILALFPGAKPQDEGKAK